MSEVQTKAKVRAVPAHVPAELVYDFDIFQDPHIVEDVLNGHMRLHREAPDFFFTPRHGGHWVAKRFDDVTRIVTTPKLFSTMDVTIRDMEGARKMPIPPLDMDAPDHMRHRLLLLKFLAPKEVAKLEPQIRELIVALIGQLESRNSCEFKAEIGVPMPSQIFMRMMRMDLSRHREFVGWVNAILENHDEEAEEAATAMHAMLSYLHELIEARCAEPSDDPVSLLLDSQVQGEKLPRALVHQMCSLLFLAGLHTVTAAMTFIIHHLAQRPEEQEVLRAEPDRIERAVEEYLRRFAFVNTPRRVVTDTEINGVKLRKGDKIILNLAAASNDDRVVSDPGRVDLDRPAAPHLAFNSGPHVCAGAPLARLELKIFLQEWLARMPNVALKPGFTPEAHTGPVFGLSRLDIVW